MIRTTALPPISEFLYFGDKVLGSAVVVLRVFGVVVVRVFRLSISAQLIDD